MLFSRSKGLVGLDIGSSAMKLVELHEKKGEFWLQRLGVEPLSPEAIVDGSIMDSSLVVDALNRLSAATGVKNPNFATSLSGHSVIIKKIQVPAMAQEDLSEQIRWEAEQYIPFDINDVRLDYQVLSDGEPGHDNMDVLLVAVKRDKVNDYVSVISQAGRVPTLVDVDDRVFTSRGSPDRMHAIRIVYDVRIVGGALRDELDGSTDTCRWVAPEDALRMRLGELARRAVERVATVDA